MTSNLEFPFQQLAAELGRPMGIRGVLIRGVGGGFGDSTGSSRGLSSPEDLQWLLLNRALADCVVVSSGTALREKYPPVWEVKGNLSTVRTNLHLPGEIPIIVVSEDSGRQSLLQSQGFLVSTHSQLPQFLADNCWDSAVCEGGPRLLNDLVARNLVRDFALTESPVTAKSVNDLGELELWLATAQRKSIWQSSGFDFQLLTSSNSDYSDNR